MTKLQLSAASFIVGIAFVGWLHHAFKAEPQVVAKHAVAVNVCGVIPAILVTYSDGSIKNFEPPFAGIPRDAQEWNIAVQVLECQGEVRLQSEVM